MSAVRNEIVRILREEDGFLVASHTNPDGDAIGSMAAMGWLLASLGKRFALYNRSGLPTSFDWLELPAPIHTDLPAGDYPWIISLDCGDLSRVGPDMAAVWPLRSSINIDHHLGNPEFATVNWVRKSYSSTGEMVAKLARDLDVPLSGALGEAVYLSIVTDTGWFSYDSTTTHTLALASRIMELGLRPGPINAKIQNQWTPARICLMRDVLGKAVLLNKGRIGLINITREVMQACEADIADTDGLINMLRRVRGVLIAIALREEPDGSIKFSLRSHGEANVQQVAARFGGGGHKNASGGSVALPIEEAAANIVAACAAILPDGGETSG